MLLEERMRELEKNNLDIRLLYKSDLDRLVITMIWRDPDHCYTLKTERLISFRDLHEPTIPVGMDSAFEFNLSNILGDMETQVLEKAEQYTYSKGENNNDEI